jgi:hypothetical protein
VPFDTEDKNPSLGDPSTQSTTPLSPKQMAGAQHATVNRTQLPSANKGPAGKPPTSENGADKPDDKGGMPGVTPDTPVLGGAEALAGAIPKIKEEADAQLHLDPRHFNPLNEMDWLKHAAESPVETFYLGRHIWDAYFGAFFGGISPSIQNIQAQDDAYAKLHPFMQVKGTQVARPQADPQQEAQVRDVATMGLELGANPFNLLPFGQARGAAMVASMLTPSVAQAIFSGDNPTTALSWGGAAALIFGVKLPAPVRAKIAEEMPNVARLFDRLSASQLARNADKAAQQDRNDLVQRILKSGAMAQKDDVLAPAWEEGMKALTKEQHSQLTSSLYERYGTLDATKVMESLVRDGASTTMLRNVFTRLYRHNYDLVHHAGGEAPLVDPMSHLTSLPTALQKEMQDGFQWTSHMVHQSHIGPVGHDADPNISRIRSMLGIGRGTGAAEKRWIEHLTRMAGPEATNPREWDLLSRSIEPVGSEAETAYQSLSPQMKVVRDSIRLVAAAAGMASEELGLLQRVHGYLPRVGLMVKEGKGVRGLRRRPQPLTTEPRVHRALAVRTVDLLTESRMQVEQAYKTVKEANDAVMRQRDYVAQSIMSRTPWYEVLQETGAGVPVIDYKEIEGIQAIIESAPETAKMEAKHYAEQLLPEFSMNPFDALPKFGRQIRAVQSQRALEDLIQATGKDGKALAAKRPSNDREADKLMKAGYRAINLPGFRQFMVNNEYAKALEDMAHLHARKPPGWLGKVLEIEGTAVSMIMFAPRIHGINMAGRLSIAISRFGPDIAEYLHGGMLQEGGLTQLPPLVPFVKGSERIGPEDYRQIAHNAGVLPPNPGKGLGGSGFAQKYLQSIADMYGDMDIGRIPLVRDQSEASGAMKASQAALNAGGRVKDMLWGKQGELWQWVSDFGVMMYWVELAAALRSGRFEDAARKAMEDAGKTYSKAEHQAQTHAAASRYAATRANSWMGHVAPEDDNPMLHAVLKSGFFAPNYWRTWGEILTGYYRNAGFGWSSDTIKYVVENEIKTAAAAVLFQQLSANALNWAFSGKTIYQNDPGNWGKVEITAPWAIAAHNEWVKRTTPKDQQAAALIDPKTGRDGKGAKLAWENPLARQMTDTEQAMGMLTSSPKITPETFRQGFSAFAAARTSPVASAFAALGNVDLYRTISADGLRFVDPNHDTLGGNPLADLITAGADLTPFSTIGQQIQQQVMQGNVGELKGPFGVPIPQAVANAFAPGQLAQDASKAFLAGLTGVNPPYMRSSKTQGVSPTDDQYKAVHELQTQYEQRMNALSTSTLSGQMAPYQWLAVYRQLSAGHSHDMQTAFKHAPEYNYGPLGLTNSWEGLYDQATDNRGVLQPDKLRTLQREWRNGTLPEHSVDPKQAAADYVAVQNELRVNDHKYPMLQLYHKTLDAYDNWQADWCKVNGVDISTLQSDLSGWSAVYSDRNTSRQWLADHPEITQFENAKKSEFESGQSKYAEAGLMYALFFNPTAADRYLNVTGETAQQVEQAVAGAQVPGAP